MSENSQNNQQGQLANADIINQEQNPEQFQSIQNNSEQYPQENYIEEEKVEITPQINQNSNMPEQISKIMNNDNQNQQIQNNEENQMQKLEENDYENDNLDEEDSEQQEQQQQQIDVKQQYNQDDIEEDGDDLDEDDEEELEQELDEIEQKKENEDEEDDDQDPNQISMDPEEEQKVANNFVQIKKELLKQQDEGFGNESFPNKQQSSQFQKLANPNNNNPENNGPNNLQNSKLNNLIESYSLFINDTSNINLNLDAVLNKLNTNTRNLKPPQNSSQKMQDIWKSLMEIDKKSIEEMSYKFQNLNGNLLFESVQQIEKLYIKLMLEYNIEVNRGKQLGIIKNEQ